MLQIRQLDHVVLRVTDLQAMMRFYMDVLGCSLEKVQEKIGLSRTIQVARRFGITSPLDVNLSLALGTSDLTLLELTSAYGAFGNQGQWLPPTTIRYVTDAQGAGDKVTAVNFAESAGAVNTYPIAVLKQSKDAELAGKFVDLVTGEAGQKVLNAAGFAAP